MKRIHVLKCWPEPFDAVVRGIKRHEYRKDDRGYAVGDSLLLTYWDPTPCPLSAGSIGYNPKRWTYCQVTYVGRGFGIPDGFAVLSIMSQSPHELSFNQIPSSVRGSSVENEGIFEYYENINSK